MFKLKYGGRKLRKHSKTQCPPPTLLILPGPVKYILTIVKIKHHLPGQKLAWLPAWRSPSRPSHFSQSDKAPVTATVPNVPLRNRP